MYWVLTTACPRISTFGAFPVTDQAPTLAGRGHALRQGVYDLVPCRHHIYHIPQWPDFINTSMETMEDRVPLHLLQLLSD